MIGPDPLRRLSEQCGQCTYAWLRHADGQHARHVAEVRHAHAVAFVLFVLGVAAGAAAVAALH